MRGGKETARFVMFISWRTVRDFNPQISENAIGFDKVLICNWHISNYWGSKKGYFDDGLTMFVQEDPSEAFDPQTSYSGNRSAAGFDKVLGCPQ